MRGSDWRSDDATPSMLRLILNAAALGLKRILSLSSPSLEFSPPLTCAHANSMNMCLTPAHTRKRKRKRHALN